MAKRIDKDEFDRLLKHAYQTWKTIPGISKEDLEEWRQTYLEQGE